MKTVLSTILCIYLLCACKQKMVQKPVWVNATDTLVMPDVQLSFLCASEKWKATLLTPTQPVQMTAVFKAGKLTVGMLHKKGIAEGPAQICLEHEQQFFFYNCHVFNADTTANISKEYRSPKTVNPDSSLQQQRLLHCYDVHRNILQVQPGNKYFFETEFSLAPIVGVYRAVKDESLSSFYIQAGSATSIPIKANYTNKLLGYNVTVGPLKDKDNNAVADGTLVAFVYKDTGQTYRMEASLLGGYATVIIPALPTKHFTLKARINETFSNLINLQP